MSRIAQAFLKAGESLEEVNLAVQVNADPGPWITSVSLGSPPGSMAQNLLQNSGHCLAGHCLLGYLLLPRALLEAPEGTSGTELRVCAVRERLWERKQ